MKTNAYKTILSQNGLSDFKKLIGKWDALAQNVENKPAGLPIILPDLFLVSRSGAGRTHMLRLLAQYLCENETLMSFYGDVKYFEFMLGYCPPNEDFSELRRLMAEVDNAAGFRNEYRGIIYIDIDEWRTHFEERHFASFIEYLADNSDEWLVVLSVTDTGSERFDVLEAFISSHLRIEKVTIDPPTTDELMEYACDLLLGYGIKLKTAARRIIADSVESLSHNKYFDGYKTVKILCLDIVYYTYIDGCRGGLALGAAEAARFAKDSEYIQRMTVNIQKANKIGFC